MKVSWQDVDDFTEKAISFAKGKNFTGVYGPARGGLPLAVMLSHGLGIPLLMAPAKGCFIVDDIADTGKTLERFAGKYPIVTMYYHKQCSFVPEFWQHEKKDEWIVFPWEKGE